MTTTCRILCLAGLSIGFALLTIQESAALSTRHDVAASEYVVKSADYPAVIDLFEPGDCLGTLVDDRHLLTVAHCAKDTKNKDVLKIGGARHGVDAVFMHPDVLPACGNWSRSLSLGTQSNVRLESYVGVKFRSRPKSP